MKNWAKTAEISVNRQNQSLKRQFRMMMRDIVSIICSRLFFSTEQLPALKAPHRIQFAFILQKI